ncbi:MAG: PEP-CTERM sorting domain-containing protein [Pirellulaceae bacterium]|nr:PEP-CTERM sorting domain-containing protein [Pirellulaceae bacterium]
MTTTNRLVYRLNLTAVNAGTYNMTANVLPSSFFTNQLDPTNTTIPFTSDTLSLNVTAVPEPSSIALLSFGVLAAGARRLNRRLRKAQA